MTATERVIPLAISILSLCALVSASAQSQGANIPTHRPLTRADARQPTSDAERTIWRLIQSMDASPVEKTNDAVFVSGTFPQPLLIGAEARSTARAQAHDTATEGAADRAAQRRNSNSQTHPIRVVVSKSEDMAYGIALFSLAFDRPDSTGQSSHVAFEGTQLTVWRKIGNHWRLAAAFNRPNG